MSNNTDTYWLQQALTYAKIAQKHNEVPIGAIIVENEQIIASGYNKPILANNPTAHAEMIAIQQACATKHNYRLPNTVLYVTLEPCCMCLGAILHARIPLVVYGAMSPKFGSIELLPKLQQDISGHSKLTTRFSALPASQTLLQTFFADKR